MHPEAATPVVARSPLPDDLADRMLENAVGPIGVPLGVATPFLVNGVEVLIPLAIGLFIKARYTDTATLLQPVMAQTSSTALMILMVLMLVLNFDSMLSVIGTGAIIALLLFIVLTFAAGYFLGGPAKDTKPVMGLGTAQRNVSAALVVG